MSIQRLHIGPRMSEVVIFERRAHLSGVVAETAPHGSVAEQTADILAGIDRLLAEAGTAKENLIQANIYLADIADFAEMNRVWDAWVPQGHTPARATVEARLAAPNLKVEIQVIAAIP